MIDNQDKVLGEIIHRPPACKAGGRLYYIMRITPLCIIDVGMLFEKDENRLFITLVVDSFF